MAGFFLHADIGNVGDQHAVAALMVEIGEGHTLLREDHAEIGGDAPGPMLPQVGLDAEGLDVHPHAVGSDGAKALLPIRGEELHGGEAPFGGEAIEIVPHGVEVQLELRFVLLIVVRHHIMALRPRGEGIRVLEGIPCRADGITGLDRRGLLRGLRRRFGCGFRSGVRRWLGSGLRRGLGRRLGRRRRDLRGLGRGRSRGVGHLLQLAGGGAHQQSQGQKEQKDTFHKPPP